MLEFTIKDVVVIGAGKIGTMIVDLLARVGRLSGHGRRSRRTCAERHTPAGQCRCARCRCRRCRRTLRIARRPVRGAECGALPSYDQDRGSRSQRRDTLTRPHRGCLLDAAALIPQCGLAPGFISIVAADLAHRLDTPDTLKLRVGALPQYPSNSLGYALTWSTDGVINEYCEPCETIADGRRVLVPALEEQEEFALDGIVYEAFNTSDGLGTLCETLEGKVRALNYRTIRYPGHGSIMKTLLQDLRLAERRNILKDIFETALPTTLQDVVVIFVAASGYRNGRLMQETYVKKIYGGILEDVQGTAIQLTTANGIYAVLDLLATGRPPSKGFILQEDIALDTFLANPFGHIYETNIPKNNR